MPQTQYPDPDIAFGQMMLKLRTSIGITQVSLAEFLGVSRRAILKWENGSNYPKPSHLQAFIGLALEHQAFEVGREAEEIRTLWHMAHQKILLDENWLAKTLEPASPDLPAKKDNPAPVPGIPADSSGTVRNQDWGEAPSVQSFSGRVDELAELAKWLTDTGNCRAVTILGMGGIGKTSISIKLGQQLASHFDFILWRSLRSAPPFSEFIAAALSFLSDHSIVSPPANSNEAISALVKLLRQKKCLIILDNLDTLLEVDIESGRYRENYADYGKMIRRLAETDHQSCLLLTTREKPRELSDLEGKASPVRTLRLNGLAQPDFQEILEDRELSGSMEEWDNLINRYGGNPLALKIVSETIRETFGGSIAMFLATQTVVFGEVGYLLDGQFNRLSELEKDLMFWLAIEREPVNILVLENNLYSSATNRRILLEALESLRRRGLLERSNQGNEYTQQPVVMEYVTARLVENVYQELLDSQPLQHLIKFALVKGQAKDYVRQSQQRMIALPLLDQLKELQKGSGQLETYLRQILQRLQAMPMANQGYAGGNILNLLVLKGSDLQGWDFSRLNLWQAYLAGIEAHHLNLTGCDLSRTVFTEGFNSVLDLAYHPDGQFLAGGTLAGTINIWQIQEQSRGYGYSLVLEGRGHTDQVSSVAYSPNGNLLVSGSYDHTIRLWDTYSGDTLQVFEGHQGPVRSVVFSPDGHLLASCSEDKTIKVWRVATGSLLATLEGHTGFVWTIAFSPDGRFLASGSYDSTIRLWEIGPVSPNPASITLEGHQGVVSGVTFSKDGQLLYSCGTDGTIRLWSVQTRQELHVLNGHNGAVQVIKLSPDGATLASGGVDQTIRLWRTGENKPRLILAGHNAPLVALAFSLDGTTLASSSSDWSVRLWSVLRGECLSTLHGHINVSYAVAVNPEGTYLIGTGSNNRALVWPLTNLPSNEAPGRPFTPCSVLKGHTGPIISLAFSSDGTQIASGGMDNQVKLWLMAMVKKQPQPEARLTLTGHTDVVMRVAFHPSGKILASGSVDGTVRLWSTITGELLAVLDGKEVVSAVAFSPDGQTIASGGNDGLIRLWDTNSYQLKHTLSAASENLPIAFLAFHPGGRFLACARYAGLINVWSTADYTQPEQTYKGRQGILWSLAFNQAQAARPALLSSSNDGTIALWDINQHKELTTLNHGGFAASVTFLPGGTRALSAGDGGLIKLWELDSGTLVATYRDWFPYEGLNISEVTGLTAARQTTLLQLGAVITN